MNKRGDWTAYVMLAILAIAAINSTVIGPWWLPAIAIPVGWLISDRIDG